MANSNDELESENTMLSVHHFRGESNGSILVELLAFPYLASQGFAQITNCAPILIWTGVKNKAELIGEPVLQ